MKWHNNSKTTTIIHVIFKICVVLLVVIGDQVTKKLVMETLVVQDSKEIIENFFYLTYTHNKGAAFGILSGELWLFFLVTVISSIGMVYYYLHTKPQEKFTRYGLLLLFSGMIGNFIDRLSLGYVVDFIDFVLFGKNFPIFNVADIAIYLGVMLIIVEILLEDHMFKGKWLSHSSEE